MSSIAAMLSAVWNDSGRPLPAVRSVQSNWMCATFAESRATLSLTIFCYNMSSGRESFRFMYVLIKILPAELNVSQFIVLLLLLLCSTTIIIIMHEVIP